MEFHYKESPQLKIFKTQASAGKGLGASGPRQLGLPAPAPAPATPLRGSLHLAWEMSSKQGEAHPGFQVLLELKAMASVEIPWVTQTPP